MTPSADAAIEALARCGVTSLPPLAFVLGSGLGVLADEVESPISIPYTEIPAFPQPSVAGHKGRLVVGELEGRRVALFQGRGHYYERGDPRAMAVAIETFKKLGGKTLFLTNAAGGLHAEWQPPALVAITDHINFSGANPLIGHASDDRFVPLTRAYDPALLATLKRAAKKADLTLHEGVYMWFNGPSFETPAEIRMAKILGADLVGMSTAPEVILARLHSLDCVAVSLVTNFAAGLSGGDPSHEETQEFAKRGSEQFRKLLRAFITAHHEKGA
jgi:purine-nucleoside phosphorylase